MVLGAQCHPPKAEDWVSPAVSPMTLGKHVPGWCVGGHVLPWMLPQAPSVGAGGKGWRGHCGPFPKSDE